jgi:hypothetical protein
MAQENPAFTEAKLRWLLFHREVNGLQRAVVKIGRRIFVDLDEFWAWVAKQNGR